MLLVIDIGNTNTVIGIYDGDHLLIDFRIHTERNTTADEYNLLLSGLLKDEFANINKTVISCVVPPMKAILAVFCQKYLGHQPKWIDSNTSCGMVIRYNNPAEVGADRIVNAVGAYHKYGVSMVIIDFGTATTFDCISDQGEYLGGAISPGIMIASEALFKKASKLPRVEIFDPPAKVIGKDTGSSLQAGIIFGYAGLVDGIVRRMKVEMQTNPMVIATGGLAALMADVCESIQEVESNLTLEGLRIISAMTDKKI